MKMRVKIVKRFGNPYTVMLNHPEQRTYERQFETHSEIDQLLNEFIEPAKLVRSRQLFSNGLESADLGECEFTIEKLKYLGFRKRDAD
jgi:hypothetical protein